MENFYKNQTSDYFEQYSGVKNIDSNQEMMPFGQALTADELINENDEALFDEIEHQVASQVRTMNTIPHLGHQVIPPVKNILDSLRCSICMETVTNPQVIKHCLHFFCKACIENAICRYKRECPLCKEQLRTHRELRAYTKMERIVNLIRPLIEKQQKADELKYEAIKQSQMQEQKQMAQLRLDQTPCSQESQGRKSKKQKEADSESLLAIRAVERESEECNEQERIKRKVEQIRSIQEKQQLQYRQMIQQQNQSSEITQQPVHNTEEIVYKKQYAQIQKKLQARNSEEQGDAFLLKHDAPVLDQRVRVLFEEDLAAMVFPKVKEFLFRISSSSPLEVAAKALALKNGHGSKWQDYSFSCVRHGAQFQEVLVDDLSRTFASLTAKGSSEDSNTDIVLFYRVKHLAEKVQTNIEMVTQEMPIQTE